MNRCMCAMLCAPSLHMRAQTSSACSTCSCLLETTQLKQLPKVKRVMQEAVAGSGGSQVDADAVVVVAKAAVSAGRASPQFFLALMAVVVVAAAAVAVKVALIAVLLPWGLMAITVR